MRDGDLCTLFGTLFLSKVGFIYLLEQEAFQECQKECIFISSRCF